MNVDMTQPVFIVPMATKDEDVFNIPRERYLELRAWIGTIVLTDLLETIRTKAILFTPFTWLEKIYKKVQNPQETAYVTFDLTMTFSTIVNNMSESAPQEAQEMFNALVMQAMSVQDYFQQTHGIHEVTQDHAQGVFTFIQAQMTRDAAEVQRMEEAQADMAEQRKIIIPK